MRRNQDPAKTSPADEPRVGLGERFGPLDQSAVGSCYIPDTLNSAGLSHFPDRKMSFTGCAPRQSIPVEMDENVDLKDDSWEEIPRQQPYPVEHKPRSPTGPLSYTDNFNHSYVWSSQHHGAVSPAIDSPFGVTGSHRGSPGVSLESLGVSLEQPGSLRSVGQQQHPAHISDPIRHRHMPHGCPPCCIGNALPNPRDVVPHYEDGIHHVSVGPHVQPEPGQWVTRTISLPDECRRIFITYSVDVANDIIPFVSFLINHGFNPAIDIFDTPIRRMGITKWMDSFLNDKSVLIIVVISPKYKEDVEGAGDEEHGLHTKYIHNQIQNEFIQQGCLNFRLVPVLFPHTTKNHVPSWLRSTSIYRWPGDRQDLLLRLLREERYIIPQRGADLTLTIRPI